jgi:hypothetical protein
MPDIEATIYGHALVTENEVMYIVTGLYDGLYMAMTTEIFNLPKEQDKLKEAMTTLLNDALALENTTKPEFEDVGPRLSGVINTLHEISDKGQGLTVFDHMKVEILTEFLHSIVIRNQTNLIKCIQRWLKIIKKGAI